MEVYIVNLEDIGVDKMGYYRRFGGVIPTKKADVSYVLKCGGRKVNSQIQSFVDRNLRDTNLIRGTKVIIQFGSKILTSQAGNIQLFTV